MRSSIIIFGGITLLGAGAAGLYNAYSNEIAGSAIISWAGILMGMITILYGFGKQTSDKMSGDKKASSKGHAEIRALVQSMGVVAVADKKIRDAEIRQIADVHEQMLGLTISTDDVKDILSEFSKDFDISSRLKRDLHLIDPEMRKTIIKCCHLVMVSDLEIAATEKERLYEIGAALGFSENDVDDMISTVVT